MTRRVILTVGNDLMGDDGAGPLLARLLEGEPAPGWTVIDGGSAPENVIHAVRAHKPELVLLFDAARMELQPGAIRRINASDVVRPNLFNTHVIPLDMLMDSLRESVPEVAFIGIQPGEVAFYAELTTPVREAVERFHRSLIQGAGLDEVPFLQADPEDDG